MDIFLHLQLINARLPFKIVSRKERVFVIRMGWLQAIILGEMRLLNPSTDELGKCGKNGACHPRKFHMRFCWMRSCWWLDFCAHLIFTSVAPELVVVGVMSCLGTLLHMHQEFEMFVDSLQK